MTNYVMTPTTMTLHKENQNPVFGESCIKFNIEDDGAGPYLILRTNLETDIGDPGTISLELKQIPAFIDALGTMYKKCIDIENANML